MSKLKKQEEQYHSLRPGELTAVRDVWGNTVYVETALASQIMRPRLLTMYHPDGRRVVEWEKPKAGTHPGYWHPKMIHPDNLDWNPRKGDYVRLLDANGRPCENFTSVSEVICELPKDLKIRLVSDPGGEYYFIVRDPSEDNETRRAWLQVVVTP